MKVDLDPSDALKLLAERTLAYDFTVWFWGDAIALDGLLDAAELAGNDEALEHCHRFFRRWAARDLSWVDHLTPGAALLRTAEVKDEDDLVAAARRLATWLSDEAPRMDKVPLYRPDQPQYRHVVWVDTLYQVPPFYARLAQVTGEEHWYDAAVEEWTEQARVLSDPQRGPFLGHSWDTGARLLHGYGWGRGVGWALYGLVETIELLPEAHPGRATLLSELQRLSSAVRELQDPTGFWRTLLHDRESYLESSTAAFFGAAFFRAVRLGLLDDSYLPVAELAWQAVQQRIDGDGNFWGVSACTWAGVYNVDDATMYRTLPTEVNVWGQGSALRIAAERLRLDQQKAAR